MHVLGRWRRGGVVVGSGAPEAEGEVVDWKAGDDYEDADGV